MPAGALPSVLERWVCSEARRKGVQPSFPALAAVTVAASAVGASLKIAVRQHDDWTEPAGLWGALIAPPGSTKTPVISAAADPLRRLNDEWLRTDGPIHAEWLKQSRKKQKADAPPLGPEPRVRRGVVDDVTFERLTGIFADNPNGLLRDTDELSGVFGSAKSTRPTQMRQHAHLRRSIRGFAGNAA